MARKKLIDKYYDGDSMADGELAQLAKWAGNASHNLLRLGHRFELAERAAFEIARNCNDFLAARDR